MSHAETPSGCGVVAVYPDHPAAERAVQQLHQAGFAMSDLSIVGRDLETTEEPVGFVSAGDCAAAGAKKGASVGGLLGLLAGAAFLVLEDLGPILVVGPLAGSMLAGIEGAIAGTALGSLAGALIGWGIPKERALKYQTQVKAGKFLVLVRGNPELVAHARALLDPHAAEHLEIFETAMS